MGASLFALLAIAALWIGLIAPTASKSDPTATRSESSRHASPRGQG